MWKAAVKNYSYVFLSCHSDVLSCLNGEIRLISVVKSAKMQNEKNFLCLKGANSRFAYGRKGDWYITT